MFQHGFIDGLCGFLLVCNWHCVFCLDVVGARMRLVCDVRVKLRICKEILVFCIHLRLRIDREGLMNDFTLSLSILFVKLGLFSIVVLLNNRTSISKASIHCNFLQLFGLLGILMPLGAFIQESRRNEGRYYAGLQRMPALCGLWSFGVVDLDARSTHWRIDDDSRLNGNPSHFGLREDNNFFCGDPSR